MRLFEKPFARALKRPLAVLLSFAIVIAAFFAVLACLAVQIAAEADSAATCVTLHMEDGPITIYTDRYVQNGVEHPGYACESTLYTITGVANRVNSVLNITHTADDAPTVTFNVVFRDLAILGEDWCSVVHFNSALGSAVEGAPAPMTVNLCLEGRNYLAGHSHPGLSGTATVNFSAAPGSYSTFTSEYSTTPEAFGSELTLNKIGAFEVKVNGQSAELEAGKTAKPVVIIGEDPAVAVKATIDALPAAADVTASDKDAITAARTAYDALSAEKKASFDADALQHLTDDEAALAAAEAGKPAKNLTALWVVLAFLAGAGCAIAVIWIIYKKKNAPTADNSKKEEEIQ